jgi:hypothetical protein
MTEISVPSPKRNVPRKKIPPRNLRSSRESSRGTAENVERAPVGTFLAGGVPLRAFLNQISALSSAERLVLVQQAIVLLEGFYAHLPLKRAMHAVDPLQRLRLLQHRLDQFETDFAFHAEMTDIFTSLRDLHTNYLLPAPFNAVGAVLPFRVEEFYEGDTRKYLVGGVAEGFSHPTFVPGVEVLYWSGIPIGRAVEIAASQHAGSNPVARRSRGIAGLTARPLIISPPPDEEWVIVGYRTADNKELELRFDWIVTGLPRTNKVDAKAKDPRAAARGIDLEADGVTRINKALYASKAIAARKALAAAKDPEARVRGTTDSIMPDVFRARAVQTTRGQFGYIRIFTFDVRDADAFVAEFVRLAALLPQNGLIVDVRDNGGGLIWAGEQLLQIMTPRWIEPERLQFINTPRTLELCRLHASDEFQLEPWVDSIDRSIETGATFSTAVPLTPTDACNSIGQTYQGPVVLVTSARCYSTTDFFTAGFQDHFIGVVLGVDENTGAGGANVFEHEDLRWMFATPSAPGQPPVVSPFEPLPQGAGMSVAIRRSLRVGVNAGTEVEDLGIKPNFRHKMTRNDLLNGNADLIERAGTLLAGMSVRVLSGVVQQKSAGAFTLELTTKNVDRVDIAVNWRPALSVNVSDGTKRVEIPVAPTANAIVILEGYLADTLVAARRVAL